MDIMKWVTDNQVLTLLGLITLYYVYSQQKFNNKRISSGKTVDLVLIYAPWCGHSKNMLPDYARITSDYHGVEMNGYTLNILKYDSDVDKAEVKKRDVDGFPSLFFEKDGKSTVFKSRKYDAIVKELEKLTSNN